jgi:hypothetical protein
VIDEPQLGPRQNAARDACKRVPGREVTGRKGHIVAVAIEVVGLSKIFRGSTESLAAYPLLFVHEPVRGRAPEPCGPVLVDHVHAIAPAIRKLVAERDRWSELSRRAITTAPEEVRWHRYVERAEDFLATVPEAVQRNERRARWRRNALRRHSTGLKKSMPRSNEYGPTEMRSLPIDPRS